MEVHHHSHKPKNWKEYITEFIMLFAAVTLGFLAENLREAKVEKERADELLISFINDVEYNVSYLDSLIKIDKRALYKTDTAAYYIITTKHQIELQRVYDNLLDNTRFLSNNDTYEQMKNSGSLRYIKDTILLHKMIEYSKEIKATEFRSATQEYDFSSHEFENTINKFIPADISAYKHSNLLIKNIDFDSTELVLQQKLKQLRINKPYLLPQEDEIEFKKVMVPVLLRQSTLIGVTLYFKNKTRAAAIDLLSYYHSKLNEH